MGRSSGSNSFCARQPLSTMLPLFQQPHIGGLQTSLSLVSSDACGSLNFQEIGPNSIQVHDSPSESASSRETWPIADGLLAKKLAKEKEGDNDLTEHSVVHRIYSKEKMSLLDVAGERVDIISDRMQQLPDEFLQGLKNKLRVILEGTGSSQHREEFLILQKLVQSRSDLTAKTLIKAHRVQLEILVAMKTGIQAFLHPSISISQSFLIDIFVYKRCRNIACQRQIPADDCKCEICTNRNGFCNLCMCVICNKFDFEVNTCRWIGCDLCSHWTHTDCSIRDGRVGMGHCVKNGAGSSGMVFRCGACSRTSELYGWVKDVILNCAPLWDGETFIRELEFVAQVFRRSEDLKGRKLFQKCDDLIGKLKGRMVESTACKALLLFFQELEIDPLKISESGEGGWLIAPQEACNQIAEVVQETVRKMEMVADEKLQMFKKARLALEACDRELEDKAKEVAELKLERQQRKQQINELESIVRLKQAEADMFQRKACDAKREAERLQSIALARSDKPEEEYSNMYLKLRLNEVESEKQYLFEKIKHQESSSRALESNEGASDRSQILMYSKIQDMLRNTNKVPPNADGHPNGFHSLSAIP